MTHRIYKAICTVAVVVFLCSLALIMELLYNYFSAVHLKQMKELAGMTARGVELNGNSFFDDFSFDGCRITWIQSDGEVLFDNEANTDHMENHLEREEVREAMTTGEGESSRYSNTLTERYVYVAVALDDGSVIRIADTQSSVLTLLLGSMQPILIVLTIGLGLSFYLAWKLSKRIVKPLNEMNLDHPDEKLVYEELAPLVKRLNSQQRQISIQRSDLQRKRDEFEAATSHMSEGIILLDEKGSILSINASARRILKATPYCVGKDILLFNNTYELQDILQRARNGEHVEKPFATDVGSYQINVSPIFSGETVTGTVLLIFDITEKEKAEQMRREFTANVSHELKTPLHTIAGYAELLANNAVKPEDIPSFSQQILADARRMSALVDDIIRLSHLDEGSGNMEQEDVNLMQIAREVVAQRATIGLHHVILDVGVLLEGLGIREGEVEVLQVVEVHLGGVATTAEGAVRVARVFFLAAFILAVLVAFLGYTLFPHVHEVDVLLAGEVVYGRGELFAFFVAVHGGEGVFQLDVGIVGVVERRNSVLAIVDVHRDFEAGFLEEFAEFEVGGDVEGGVGLKGVVGDAAVEGAKAGRAVGAADGDAAHVGQNGLEASRGGDAALAVEVGEAQLIDPHHGALGLAVVDIGEVLAFRVADTDHHGFHVADARVTNHLDGVVVVFTVNGAFLLFLGVDVVQPHIAVGLGHGFVTVGLHLDEVFQ